MSPTTSHNSDSIPKRTDIPISPYSSLQPAGHKVHQKHFGRYQFGLHSSSQDCPLVLSPCPTSMLPKSTATWGRKGYGACWKLLKQIWQAQLCLRRHQLFWPFSIHCTQGQHQHKTDPTQCYPSQNNYVGEHIVGKFQQTSSHHCSP